MISKPCLKSVCTTPLLLGWKARPARAQRRVPSSATGDMLIQAIASPVYWTNLGLVLGKLQVASEAGVGHEESVLTYLMRDRMWSRNARRCALGDVPVKSSRVQTSFCMQSNEKMRVKARSVNVQERSNVCVVERQSQSVTPEGGPHLQQVPFATAHPSWRKGDGDGASRTPADANNRVREIASAVVIGGGPLVARRGGSW